MYHVVLISALGRSDNDLDYVMHSHAAHALLDYHRLDFMANIK